MKFLSPILFYTVSVAAAFNICLIFSTKQLCRNILSQWLSISVYLHSTATHLNDWMYIAFSVCCQCRSFCIFLELFTMFGSFVLYSMFGIRWLYVCVCVYQIVCVNVWEKTFYLYIHKRYIHTYISLNYWVWSNIRKNICRIGFKFLNIIIILRIQIQGISMLLTLNV